MHETLLGTNKVILRDYGFIVERFRPWLGWYGLFFLVECYLTAVGLGGVRRKQSQINTFSASLSVAEHKTVESAMYAVPVRELIGSRRLAWTGCAYMCVCVCARQCHSSDLRQPDRPNVRIHSRASGNANLTRSFRMRDAVHATRTIANPPAMWTPSVRCDLPPVATSTVTAEERSPVGGNRERADKERTLNTPDRNRESVQRSGETICYINSLHMTVMVY